MKQIVVLTASARRARESGIAEMFPEGLGDSSFHFRLPVTDPRVDSIVRAFDEMGFSAWSGRDEVDYKRQYTLLYVREYEPSDFEVVEYLEFWPEQIDAIGDEGRDEQGLLRIERPTLKNAWRAGLDFASATLGQILVLQPVREALLEGQFAHLIFRPTTLITGRGTRPGRHTPIPWERFKATKPWWELTSDQILPPLSPSMDLRDDAGNPIAPGDCSRGCVPKDGQYNHAELHYRRSDLKRMEPFDVALTFENFGVRGHTETYGTIVSKRFYDYCMQKGLKGRWAPVRIDPD